ncbi:hypothetical protein LSTR_LSTR007860 [Laodelphax striatellus]|uniref:DDE Tnp4 domain-containing protein n=1 Tax=Laodelphax striatellus TaxID=195883 RepID=A0A482WNT6_LAOST|nr:hypothetical protein LSTR_LSTR007860 [Laodelphax striatellus]
MAVAVNEPTKRKKQNDGENEKVAKKKIRSIWVKEDREERYYKYEKAECDIPFKFMEVLGIDDAAFNSIKEKISHKIKMADTLMRQAIPAKLKLQVFLEYVSTGSTLTGLERLFHCSTSSMSKFIPEVANAICETFAEYIQAPGDESEWKKIADGFKQSFSTENCVGVIQGKTIYSRNWARYSKDTAIYFWFAADTSHSLVCVDIGTCPTKGLEFARSNLAKSVDDKSVSVPDGCYFIGPSGVQLDKCIITPYISQSEGMLSSGEEIFNRKVAQISEAANDTFNLLRKRFKVFDNPVTLAPESVVKLLKCACILHNWMQRIVKPEVCNSEEVANAQSPATGSELKSASGVFPAPGSELSSGLNSAPGMFNLIPSYDGYNEEAVLRRYVLTEQFVSESTGANQPTSVNWNII